ncbi:MAG: hypothetical protein RLZZ600_92, partial [Actinomycetota bacterium]
SVAGEYLQPTAESMATEIAARSAGSSTVVPATNWSASVSGGYPLTEVVYGAVNVCSATKDERAAYVNLLNYAIGDGQNLDSGLGSLPLGYEPITEAQRATAQTAIADVSEPANLSTRCPAAETTETITPPVVVTPPVVIGTIDDGSGTSVAHKKLFIVKPVYGSGETTDRLPLVARTLSAGGYALGIPLLIAGGLLLMRSRNRPIPQLD